MYLTVAIYESDGVQRDFAVPFPFINQEYVKAYKQTPDGLGNYFGNLEPLEYDWINDGLVRLKEVVPSGNRVVIRRETFADTPLVDFQDSAILTEDDLDIASLQSLHVAQEAREASEVNLESTYDYLATVISDVAEVRDEAQAVFENISEIAEDTQRNAEEAAESKRASEAAANDAQYWAEHAATVGSLDEHLSAPDPHPQYLTDDEVASMAFVEDAPADGNGYVRKGQAWALNESGDPFPFMIGEARSYFGPVPNKEMFEPNFIYADGREVSREDYPELFAVYGTVYGTGDGSTTFNVPDLRGVFVRGLDEGRGLDPGRVMGALQGDAIRNITGGMLNNGATGNVNSFEPGALYGLNRGGSTQSGTTSGIVAVMFDASRSVPTANENRPVNMACSWFIFAKSPAMASSSDFSAAITAVNAGMANKFDKNNSGDLAMLSGLGMPSERYVDFTLPESGGTYTPPANGYVFVTKLAELTGQTLFIGYGGVTSKDPRVGAFAYSSGINISAFLPVRRNQVIAFSYGASGPIGICRFIYAEGN